MEEKLEKEGRIIGGKRAPVLLKSLPSFDIFCIPFFSFVKLRMISLPTGGFCLLEIFLLNHTFVVMYCLLCFYAYFFMYLASWILWRLGPFVEDIE